MRVGPVLLLVLAACVGAAGDVPASDDADTDTRADTDGAVVEDPTVDTDTPDGVPVYTAVEPVTAWATEVVDGRTVTAYVPSDAKGLLFVFHGTGGDASVATSTEMVAVLNAMVARGIGFVAPSSQDEARGIFDDASGPGSNADWKRVVAVREALLAEGLVEAGTPVHAFGYSAGGGMATYVAHEALAAGWTFGGLDLMHTGGVSRRHGDPPDVPLIATGAVNDTAVPLDAVRKLVDRHTRGGGDGSLLVHEEQALAPTRFARTPFVTAKQSRDLVALAIAGGDFDDRGRRTFPVGEIDTRIEAFVARPDTAPDKPIRAVLNVVLATHAINGEHAVAEAAFLAELP